MAQDEYQYWLQGINARYSRRSRIELVLNIYSLLGVLLALLGAGYLILTLLPFELSHDQKLAAAVVGFGLAIAVMSQMVISIRKKYDSDVVARKIDQESIVSFLNTWEKFEAVSRNALEKKGEKFDRYSLRSIISKLNSEGEIDDADVRALEEALQARNTVIHSKEPLSASFVQEITNLLVHIIQKISVK